MKPPWRTYRRRDLTRGRPRLYSDALIQALLGIKTVFRLPLRALHGFAQSLRELAFTTCPYRTTQH